MEDLSCLDIIVAITVAGTLAMLLTQFMVRRVDMVW
jgi:hypothetical protein